MADFTQEQIEMLNAPLPATLIKQRQGGGNKTLNYLSGDAVIRAADRIFGYGKWGYKVVSRGSMVINDPKKGEIVMYTADVELSVEGAAFTFPGGGCGIVNGGGAMEHEKAYKEAETDAMKRALRHYGDQFGLCLYDGEETVAMPDGSLGQVKNVKAGQNNKPAPNTKPTTQPRQQMTSSTPAKAPAPSTSQPKKDPMTIGQLTKALQEAELIDEVTGRVVDRDLLIEITGNIYAEAGRKFNVTKIQSLPDDAIPPAYCAALEATYHLLMAAKEKATKAA